MKNVLFLFFFGVLLGAQSITTLQYEGGRVDWSADGSLVAFDRIGPDGWFDLWTMYPDGTGAACITCGKIGFSTENNGNPAWHPSGKFIAYQATDVSLKSVFDSSALGAPAYVHETNPGAGFHNN